MLSFPTIFAPQGHRAGLYTLGPVILTNNVLLQKAATFLEPLEQSNEGQQAAKGIVEALHATKILRHKDKAGIADQRSFQKL